VFFVWGLKEMRYVGGGGKNTRHTRRGARTRDPPRMGGSGLRDRR
jgi:hypothetical protein